MTLATGFFTQAPHRANAFSFEPQSPISPSTSAATLPQQPRHGTLGHQDEMSEHRLQYFLSCSCREHASAPLLFFPTPPFTQITNCYRFSWVRQQQIPRGLANGNKKQDSRKDRSK